MSISTFNECASVFLCSGLNVCVLVYVWVRVSVCTCSSSCVRQCVLVFGPLCWGPMIYDMYSNFQGTYKLQNSPLLPFFFPPLSFSLSSGVNFSCFPRYLALSHFNWVWMFFSNKNSYWSLVCCTSLESPLLRAVVCCSSVGFGALYRTKWDSATDAGLSEPGRSLLLCYLFGSPAK